MFWSTGIVLYDSQLVKEHLIAWQGLSGQIQQVLVVGKEDHLGLGRYSHELFERLDRPMVVEMYQNIIDDQRHWLVQLAPLFKTREPQS